MRTKFGLFVGILAVSVSLAAEPDLPTPPPQHPPGVTVKKLGVKTSLRSNPSYDGEIVATVDPGSEAELLTVHEDGEWYWVKVHQSQGWVNVTAFEGADDLVAGAAPVVFHPEDVHHLVRLKKYPFLETMFFGGTSTLRGTDGRWIQGVRSAGLGGGFGWGVFNKEGQGFALIEAVGDLHRETASNMNKAFWSYSLGGRAKYLQAVNGDFGVGAGMAVLYHISPWPKSFPVQGRTSGFQIPLFLATSYEWSPRWVGFLDLALHFGRYPGVGMNVQVAWIQ